VTDRNSPNENEGEKISPSKRGATGRCTTTERPLTTKANAKDATTPFPRKSLKRVASIAAEFPPMKAAGMPLKFDRDSGAVTSRMVSPIKLKIRKFLRTSAGPSIAPTIVRLNEWLASIQARTLEKPVARKLANGDPIERIAEGLIANACGTERGLLSKSLRETLYYSVGFDENIPENQLTTRLSRYLIRRGAPAFIRRFLSLFFFNFVLFETSESFRGLARSLQDFERDLEDLDRVCHQTVASVWKSFERTRRPLDLSAVADLVRQIEHRLRGN
jgi:hypothetical protein